MGTHCVHCVIKRQKITKHQNRIFYSPSGCNLAFYSRQLLGHIVAHNAGYSDRLAWSVCLSVCLFVYWAQPWAVQKRLNRSNAVWRGGLLWPKESPIRWGCTWAPHGEYDWTICAAARTRAGAIITVATVVIFVDRQQRKQLYRCGVATSSSHRYRVVKWPRCLLQLDCGYNTIKHCDKTATTSHATKPVLSHATF